MTVKFFTCSSCEQEVEAGNISVQGDRSNETHVAELDEFIAQVVKENAEALVKEAQHNPQTAVDD